MQSFSLNQKRIQNSCRKSSQFVAKMYSKLNSLKNEQELSLCRKCTQDRFCVENSLKTDISSKMLLKLSSCSKNQNQIYKSVRVVNALKTECVSKMDSKNNFVSKIQQKLSLCQKCTKDWVCLGNALRIDFVSKMHPK